MTKEEVAGRIQELSRERGIHSGYQLAARCTGVGRQTIYNTLNGKSSPTVETLELICRGLEITLQDFFRVDDARIVLSRQERLCVELTRRLEEKDRWRVLAYIEGLADSSGIERLADYPGREGLADFSGREGLADTAGIERRTDSSGIEGPADSPGREKPQAGNRSGGRKNKKED